MSKSKKSHSTLYALIKEIELIVNLSPNMTDIQKQRFIRNFQQIFKQV
jgi:hypothetical protein